MFGYKNGYWIQYITLMSCFNVFVIFKKYNLNTYRLVIKDVD